MQKIMICTTTRRSIRAEIDGLSFEDGNLVIAAYRERRGTVNQYEFINDVPVGLVDSPKYEFYKTVLHAIGDGWRLLAPPSALSLCGDYEWYLVKE